MTNYKSQNGTIHLFSLIVSYKSYFVYRNKKFTCETCGATKKSNHTLKMHIAKVHEGKVFEKKFACDKCEKRFEQMSNLTYHIKFAHEGWKPEKKFSCPHCDYKAAHKQYIKTHILGTVLQNES